MDEAKRLGKMIVEQKLASCVDFWPVGSMYYWKNEFKAVSQAMLMITSLETKLQGIEDLLAKNHSYSVPLTAGVDVRRINRPYKEWMAQTLE